MKKELIERIQNLISTTYDIDGIESDSEKITEKYIEIKTINFQPRTLSKLLELVDDLNDRLINGDTQSVGYKKSLNRLLKMNDFLSRNEEFNKILDNNE